MVIYIKYMDICLDSDCSRETYAKGLCLAHYKRQWRGSKIAGPIQEPRIPGVRPCGKNKCPAAQRLRAHVHYRENKQDYIDRANSQSPEDRKSVV